MDEAVSKVVVEPDLKDMVREIYRKQSEVKPVKKSLRERVFRLPFLMRFSERRAGKKRKLLMILLGTNRFIQFKFVKLTKDDTVIWKEKEYECSMDFIYLWKRVPVIVLPEWSLIPIGTKDFYDAVAEKRTANPQTLIISMLKRGEVQDKKKFAFQPWMWILVFIAAGAAIYFFFIKK